MNRKEKRISLIKRMLIIIALSFSWSLIISTFITGHLWELHNLQQNFSNLRIWTTLNRAYIFFFFLLYAGIHFVFPCKDIYCFLFKKRWIVGILLLVFLTINKYHGDSIGVYSEVIQANTVSQSSTELFGESRAIRSDEYVVTTPAVLASGMGDNPYGQFNNILRGTETLNIVNGVYGGYATVGYAPWELVYLFLPVENSFSFCWYAPLILSFLMTLEMFYVVSKRKLLATTGAFLVVFSSFYLWWGFSAYYFAAPGTIVCLHYFFNAKKNWLKCLYGMGMALCFSIFVTNLYPAWQVPLGYVFLVLGIWALKCNWDTVKRMKTKEWLILGVSLIFCVSLIISYLISISDYTISISQTVYPGDRISTGGFDIWKQFYYAQAPLYAYKYIDNPSEYSVFFSLFPIPTIAALYVWIKRKRRDFLLTGLLVVEVIMLLFVTVGFPRIISTITLFSYSTTSRVNDVIGLIQIILMIVIFSFYEKELTVSKLPAIVIGSVIATTCIMVSRIKFPGYLSSMQSIVMFLIIVVCCLGILCQLSDKVRRKIFLLLIGISVFTSIYIRPVMKGLDAIYTRPVAGEIAAIQKEDEKAKWITLGRDPFLSAFCVSCGAPTINSVNIYPNLKLWEKLDSKGEYNDVYNRYARVEVKLTEKPTTFKAIQQDTIQLSLSYKDIKKTGATYLLAGEEVEIKSNKYVCFDKMYDQEGIVIYKIRY